MALVTSAVSGFALAAAFGFTAVFGVAAGFGLAAGFGFTGPAAWPAWASSARTEAVSRNELAIAATSPIAE
jgi:hypothetical protein